MRATTKHQNVDLQFGYICTICHDYKAAASNNVYTHIRKKHPEHEPETLAQLKQYVGILNHRNATMPAPALQKEGQLKCPHENCDRVFQGSSGLWNHRRKHNH
jgi:hypothetical protein